jgi:hypothetical protein
MSSTATPALQLEMPAQGDYTQNWATWIDTQLLLIDQAIAGIFNVVSTGGAFTIVQTQFTSDENRSSVIWVASGSVLTQDLILNFPASGKNFYVGNNSSGPFNVFVRSTSVVVGQGGLAGNPGLNLPQGAAVGVRVNTDGSLSLLSQITYFATGLGFQLSQDVVS